MLHSRRLRHAAAAAAPVHKRRPLQRACMLHLPLQLRRHAISDSYADQQLRVAPVLSGVHENFAHIWTPPDCAAGRWAIDLGRSCPRQYRWPSRTARPPQKTTWSCRSTASRSVDASAASLAHPLPLSSGLVLAPMLLAGSAAQHIDLTRGDKEEYWPNARQPCAPAELICVSRVDAHAR